VERREEERSKYYNKEKGYDSRDETTFGRINNNTSVIDNKKKPL
jgi:hypothetical protein